MSTNNNDIIDLNIYVNYNGLITIDTNATTTQQQHNTTKKHKLLIDRHHNTFKDILNTQYDRLHDMLDNNITLDLSNMHTNTATHNNKIHTPTSPKPVNRIKLPKQQIDNDKWDHAGFEKLQLQQEAEQQDKAKQKNYKLQHNNNNITTSDKVTNLHSYKPINCYSNNSGSSIQLSRNNNNGRTRNSYSLYKQLLTAQHEQKVQQMQKQMNQYSDITHTDNDIQQNINEGKRQNSKHYNRSLYRPYSANQNSKLTNAPRMSTRTIQQQQQQRSNSNNNNNNTTTSVFVYKPRIPILSIKIKINQNFTMFDIYNDTDIQKQCSELCNNMGQPDKIRALYNFVIEKLEAANITQQQQQEQN